MKRKKNNGKALEKLVESLCTQFSKDAKVQHNVFRTGKITGTRRQIDVLIEGIVGPCPVTICIDAKDYKSAVDVNEVSALATNLEDIGGNIGVIVCPKGFTSGAQKMALQKGIQLLVPISNGIESICAQPLIPIRCIISYLDKVAFKFTHRVNGPAELPIDLSYLRVKVGDKNLNLKQLALHSWNTGEINPSAGTYVVQLNAMTVQDVREPSRVQYFEIELKVSVKDNFYLGVLPISGFQHVGSKKKTINLDINAQRIEKEWTKFSTLEEMEEEARKIDLSPDVKNILIKPFFTVDLTDIGPSFQDNPRPPPPPHP